jgi:hypothetical protein
MDHESPARTDGPDSVNDLIATYDAYIDLLSESERDLLGLAYVHGYRCPSDMVERGAVLRGRIAILKHQVTDSGGKEQPNSRDLK